MTVVSDSDKLTTMYPGWDSFVESYASSPYFLKGLLRVHSHSWNKRRRPFAVVMSEGDSLVGLAAFRMKDSYVFNKRRLFKFQSVQFLLPDWWSPDFVVRPERRQEFVEGVMTLLFDKLGFRTARLTLPSDSPNVPILTQWCERRRMSVQTFHNIKNAVLEVRGTWDDYFRSRGKDFVSNHRTSELRLTMAGRWGVSTGRVESRTVVDKIMEVDRNSWKEGWRRNRGEIFDETLVGLLQYYRHGTASRFCPQYWLLELDGRPIAFSMAIILGRVAYMVKTSYDTRYRHYSPGQVVNFRAIHDLFESGSISWMDFFTSYDFVLQLASEVRKRETFIIENHRGPFKLLMRLERSKYSAKVLGAMTGWIRMNS